MGHILRLIFLTFLTSSVVAADRTNQQTLAPGQQVADFTMLSSNGFGQRLAEQRGQAVMLIWLEHCYDCEEELASYQLLAESLKKDGLTTWFIWPEQEDDRPPRMRLPVLKYQPQWQTGWLFSQRPAVMLINPEQVLDHLYIGDLDDQLAAVQQQLPLWLAQFDLR